MTTNDIKKSQFITKDATGVSSTDTFDFVQDGQNFKITLAELATKLGVTGTLAQLGDATGIPTLKITGAANELRNVIGGPGILASLSVADGIEIKQNFTVDATGVPILINPTFASPTLRSLVAGSGINISASNGSIQFALAATPASTKTVIVNEMTDFPAAVGSVITLDADTAYFVTNDLTTASRFVLQDDTVVMATDGTLISLVYTGTDTMFTSVNASNKIKDIRLTCATGKLLDVSGAGTEIFQLINLNVDSCDEIGDIDGISVLNIENVVWSNIITTGMLVAGSINIMSIFQNITYLNGGKFIDLGTCTFNGFNYGNSMAVLAAGTYNISGMVSSGNVNTGGLGAVTNNRAWGLGTPIENITTKDALWQFHLNSGAPDSRSSALLSNAGCTVTIAASNTPVIIGATWVAEDLSRFTATAGGRFTYIGSGDTVSITASITADVASGVDDCTFYVYKNGIQEANSGILRELDAGDPGNLSVVWELTLTTGDYVELWAENNDTSVNVVIHKAVLRIS